MGNETSQQQENELQPGVQCGARLPSQAQGASQGATSLRAIEESLSRGPQAHMQHGEALSANPLNSGVAPVAENNEGALLSQLIQLLHQRPRSSLLLSDLGALLPQPVRVSLKERGGLRSWLQKHPMLFQVSGQPGKESVTLTLGGPSDGATPAAGTAAGGRAHASQDQEGQSMSGAQSTLQTGQMQLQDDEEETASCVQMRGLPYRATATDVKTFLGSHLEFLKDEQSVQLVLNRDGRPSGFARVQFNSPAAARVARDALHNGVMKTAGEGNVTSQERYVEIFLYSERPNKLRFRKGLTSTDGQTGGPVQEEVDNAVKEQLIQECRDHMSSAGKGQLLLSMLGVALSPTSRLHLKKTDLGMKHFLSQYPNEFRVDGVKGREQITYLPAMQPGMQPTYPPAYMPAMQPGMQSLPTGYFAAPQANMAQQQLAFQMAAAQQQTPPEPVESAARRRERGPKGTTGPATGNLNELTHENLHQMNSLLHSPGRNPCSPGIAARGLATPSDWGTPQANDFEWEQRARPQQSTEPQITQAPDPGSSPLDFMNSFGCDPTNSWAAWGVPPVGVPPPGTAPTLPPTMPMGMPGYWPGMPAPAAVPPWMAGMPGSAPVLPADAPPWLNPMMAGLGRPAFNPFLPAGVPGQGMPTAMPIVPTKSEMKLGQGPTNEHSCTLRLRGLPFTCSEQEVYAFFSKFDVVENIADTDKAVQFLTKSTGKPSGQATVRMASREDAVIAERLLHGQWLGSRYIEVFPYVEDAVAEKVGGGAKVLWSAQDPDLPSAGDTGGSGGISPCLKSESTGVYGGIAPGIMPGSASPWPQGLGTDRDLQFRAAVMSMAQARAAAGTPMDFAALAPMFGSAGTGGPGAQQADMSALFDFLKTAEGAPNPACMYANPI